MGQTERFHDARVAIDAEREPVEVARGLWMIALRSPTLPPATHTNAFLVGTADAVLVEPASPYDEEVERVVDLVRARERTGLLHLRAILVTHHHPDHVGGAVRLKGRLGLPLWGHPDTIDRLRGRVSFERPIFDEEVIELGGDPPMRLVAMHTPGHAPGHLCFLEPRSGALIAGDMVAGVGTIVVEPTDGDMALYLDSLRKMRAAGPRMLLPAHGGPIHDPEGCIDYYLRHRLEREGKVAAALAAHPSGLTLHELLATAYADAPAAARPLALLSMRAHLDKLEREGRARRHEDGRWQKT